MPDKGNSHVYIFKVNRCLRKEDIEQIRNGIKKQLDEGVLVLDSSIDFLGRELNVNGITVMTEFIVDNETLG